MQQSRSTFIGWLSETLIVGLLLIMVIRALPALESITRLDAADRIILDGVLVVWLPWLIQCLAIAIFALQLWKGLMMGLRKIAKLVAERRWSTAK